MLARLTPMKGIRKPETGQQACLTTEIEANVEFMWGDWRIFADGSGVIEVCEITMVGDVFVSRHMLFIVELLEFEEVAPVVDPYAEEASEQAFGVPVGMFQLREELVVFLVQDRDLSQTKVVTGCNTQEYIRASSARGDCGDLFLVRSCGHITL